MTSPSISPQSFHRRPICPEANRPEQAKRVERATPILTVQLPPARHLVFQCARCPRRYLHHRPKCDCGCTILRQGIEVTSTEYARLIATAA